MTFTDELERRLREVLSLRVQAPLPSDVPVTVRAQLAGFDRETEIEIYTTAHPYAAWSYEEPGAWERLLADLEAVSDPPTAPRTDRPRQPPGM